MSAVLPHPDLAHLAPATPEKTDLTMANSLDTTYRITTPRVVKGDGSAGLVRGRTALIGPPPP